MLDREYMATTLPPLGHFPCPVRAVSIYGGECRREYMAPLGMVGLPPCPRLQRVSALAIPCRRLSACRGECSRDYMPDKPCVAGSSPASHPFGGDVAQLVEQGTSRNPLSPRFIQNGARTPLRAPFHFGSAYPSYDRRSRTLLYLREAPKIGLHIRGLYLVPVLAAGNRDFP
jgi:hypothetical protein